MVNWGGFLQHTPSNFDGEFLHTLLVTVTVNCGEFLRNYLECVVEIHRYNYLECVVGILFTVNLLT